MALYKVCCIIVTYNGERWIEKCISSINEPFIELKILVIDNGSTDHTVEIVKKKFPAVQLHEMNENLGFGRANNYGYEIARKDNVQYIYLLNQDTVSYENNIYNLIQIDISNENFGVISPIHLNDNGDKLDQNFEGNITAKSCKHYISDFTLGRVKPYYEIGFVNAAAWLLRIDVVESLGGLFSTAFFHYGEDVNYIGRLRHFGYKIIIVPNVYIHHCREERKGLFSKEFQSRIVDINKITMMHDIKSSYSTCYKSVLKYALQQLSLGNIYNFFKLVSYPILKYRTIRSFRKSYYSKKLIKG